MFFGIRLNSALARLGIRPAVISGPYRRQMQQAGRTAGIRPKKLPSLSLLGCPSLYRCELSAAQRKIWMRQHKIDPRAPEVCGTRLVS